MHAERPGELVVDRRHFLLLHLDHPERELTRAPPELLPRMLVGEPHLDLPLGARLEPDDRLVHLGQDPPAADLERVPLLLAGLGALRTQLVVDHHEVAHAGGPGGGDEGRALLGERRQRRLDVGVRHRMGRVPDGHPPVLAERDRRLDLHDRREAEGPALLEIELAEIGILDRPELRLVHGAAVDRRDERLGHRLAHLVREPRAHQRHRHLAPPEPREAGVTLDAAARRRPGRPHFLLGGLDDQLPLARIELLNLDLHQMDRVVVLGEVWCERGELNPQGIAPTGS